MTAMILIIRIKSQHINISSARSLQESQTRHCSIKVQKHSCMCQHPPTELFPLHMINDESFLIRRRASSKMYPSFHRHHSAAFWQRLKELQLCTRRNEIVALQRQWPTNYSVFLWVRAGEVRGAEELGVLVYELVYRWGCRFERPLWVHVWSLSSQLRLYSSDTTKGHSVVTVTHWNSNPNQNPNPILNPNPNTI